MATDQNFRSEHDSIGDRALPKDAYYGVQSLRAAENFHITGLTMHPEIINSIAEIKKASAITNAEIGLLDKKIATPSLKPVMKLSPVSSMTHSLWTPFRAVPAPV